MTSDLATLLGPEGPLAEMPGYEHRPDQVKLAQFVERAFARGESAMVEAGTGFGKCLHGATLVTLADGSRLPIAELVGRRFSVATVDEALRSTCRPIAACFPSGRKAMFRLTTRLGHFVVASADHPLYTFAGWKRLADLRVGDRVAAARRIAILGDVPLPESEVRYLALMLADGSCSNPDGLHYDKADPAVVADWQDAVRNLENSEPTTTRTPHRYGIRRHTLAGRARCGAVVVLERHGVAGKLSKDKRIPSAVFRLPEEQLALFVGRLFSGDGSIERSGVVSYTSASEGLARDLQHLLLRLGVISRLRRHDGNLSGRRYPAWSLGVMGIEPLRAFAQTAGEHLVGAKAQRLADLLAGLAPRGNPNAHLVPAEVWQRIDDARRVTGLSWDNLTKSAETSCRKRQGISPTRLKAIAVALGDHELGRIADSDVYWDAIVMIESAGEDETFDIEMEDPEWPAYLANDLVVHNTIAYLLPALQRARATGQPAIVATATIALQEQIARHDAVLLRKVLPDLRLVVLKGRGHYACLRAIELLAEPTLREAALAARRGGAVFREEFPTEIAALWPELSAASCDSDCLDCPLKAARETARRADIVVVSHALLLADDDGTLLPDPSALVIDEAHRLIDVATEARSLAGAPADLDALLEVGVPSGLKRAASELHRLLTGLLLAAPRALRGRLGDGDLRVSVSPTDEIVSELFPSYERLAPRLSLWLAAAADLPVFGPARLRFNAQLNRIVDFALALDAFFAPPAELQLVRWFDFADGSFHVAPLSVGAALRATVWRRCGSALLISATLAGPRGEFDFTAFGLSVGPTLRLSSPFDYARSCALAIPRGLASARDPSHVHEVARTLFELAFVKHGRVLALFTSHAELAAVDELLQPLLRPRGIRVLAQGRSGERDALLEEFRAGDALLLGTNTFWEGIDLVGDVLQLLVISRLPFDVPTDPLHAARARLKRDPFRDYTLPRAALRLRQGFGRLIRSERDRGLVIVLDPRLRTKGYGQELVSSLPPCTLFTGELEELATFAGRFLDQGVERAHPEAARAVA